MVSHMAFHTYAMGAQHFPKVWLTVRGNVVK